MKKTEYLKPAVKVRFVVFDTPLCGESLPYDPVKEIDDENDFEAWSKGFDVQNFNSVWEED